MTEYEKTRIRANASAIELRDFADRLIGDFNKGPREHVHPILVKELIELSGRLAYDIGRVNGMLAAMEKLFDGQPK